MSETGTWFVVEGRQAKWQRAAWRSPDGTIYLPAILTGKSENSVMLRASYAAIGVVVFKRHLYVPAQWLAAEFPTCREVCERITATIAGLMAH